MKIQEQFENYERYRGELEADLCMLADILHVEMPEPDGNTNVLGRMLRKIEASVDFVADDRIEKRLEHAKMRFKQLTLLEWAIRSRPRRQQEILYGLYVERLSWQELMDELHVSQMTISRDRKQAFTDLEKVLPELW